MDVFDYHQIPPGNFHRSISQNTNNNNIDSKSLLRTLSMDQDQSVRKATQMVPYEEINGKESDKACKSWTKNLKIQEVAKRGRMFAKRKKSRLINKSGECQFSYINTDTSASRILKYIRDIFTTLLDIKWRYVILLFTLAFFLSWLLFALIWWVICVIHGDYKMDDTIKPCVVGVHGFVSALLFSIETQHTIGYGTRAVTEQCGVAIIFMMIQSVVGVLIQCIITGVVFAKLARPKNRAKTVIFSRNAVICQRDGYRFLMFRVGDMRRSQFISTTVNAMLIRKRVFYEGEDIPFFRSKLTVNTEAEDDFFFMAWPIKILHRIDESSPLYHLSADQLVVGDFEIIVVLEGVNESSGMTTQIRTSYLPSEILWGQRLANLEAVRKDNKDVQIDYRRFHETIPIPMADISARQLQHRRESVRSNSEHSTKTHTLFSFVNEQWIKHASLKRLCYHLW